MRWRPAVAVMLATGLFGMAACTGTREATSPDAAPGAAATSASGAAATPGPTGTPTPAGTAPTTVDVPPILGFEATTLDGQAFRGASLAGRPAVLWFWAPWCATCAGQAPTVARLAQQYGGRVAIIGVAGLGETKAMHEFVSDTEVGGVTHLNDQAGAVWRRFQIAEQ
ncbi:MAG TPA: redoxin domain-containing protein, partial [Pilimelia sp.]|nr:redoxin domain-containing protein [Pilimelia sp.]